ncbi:MAG: hypothetical protein HQ542_01910, partial [Bacteroidia bacterium]|nr:hypothetical protein [Bacteroidia bacterium]
MKIKIIIGLILLLPGIGFSQGEWNNWYFGVNAAIKFIGGIPVSLSGSAMGQSAGGSSVTVSDSSGNLLFYSNGRNIYDSTNTLMPNGTGLYGGNLCTQPVFTAQSPNNPDQYYLFTVGGSDTGPGNPWRGLHYSIVDMNLHGGLGDVVAGMKNIPVPNGDSAHQQFTGIRHSNNQDIWIVTRQLTEDGKYLAYLITTSGIQIPPVISNSGLQTRTYYGAPTRGGDLRISPDGNKLVCSDSLTELCNFNPSSGEVTPLFIFNVMYGSQSQQLKGAEFSVDNRYLYLCMSH